MEDYEKDKITRGNDEFYEDVASVSGMDISDEIIINQRLTANGR